MISYSPSPFRNGYQWGSNLSPDAVAIANTKLDLETRSVSEDMNINPQNSQEVNNRDSGCHNVDQGRPERYFWKSPVEIVTDFLTKVFEVLTGNLFREEDLLKVIPVDFVITVPGNWSYGALDSLFQAVDTAFKLKQTFPALCDILAVSETEAAAIYAVRSIIERDNKEILKVYQSTRCNTKN